MSRYRKVDPRIWNDEKFRDLSDSAKLIFFMLLTHPNMTSLGAMRATVAGLAEEMGWSAEAFREAFRELISKGMAEHDQKACLIALPRFVKYNPPESPNVVKAWVGALDLLPECELKTRVIARSADYAKAMSKGFAEALPEAFAKGMPNQKQEQKQEQEQEAADAACTEGARPAEKPAAASTKSAGDPDHLSNPTEFCTAVLDAYESSWGSRPPMLMATMQRILALIAQHPRAEAAGWWASYFAFARTDEFLSGEKRPGFVADLNYLLKPDVFGRVIEASQRQAVAHG